MKLAISNIAWNPPDDEWVAAAMREHRFAGVEIAPTKIWSKPAEVSESEARRYRDLWEARGLPIVAMQSLLFGQPDLCVFGSELERRALLDFLSRVMRLASWLGVRVLVFGSPKNRRRGSLAPADAFAAAVPLFREAGDVAASLGVVLCIEPNPPVYDCDFVTTADEGRAFVDTVASPGFGLHLDAAGMHLAGEDGPAALARHAPILRHFHISEPELGPVGAATHSSAADPSDSGAPPPFATDPRPALLSGPVPHSPLASTLHAARYPNFCSIEMRATPAPDTASAILRALAFAAATYGNS
jgi:D-psicose/D-tagatose/L-ribulose 3-epimerase